MTLELLLFGLLAIVTGGSALGVVLTNNIVRAAVFLLFTLLGVSGLYLLLAAEFVGATQLIVYVGGTLVLVVFGIMLTATSPFARLPVPRWEFALSALIACGIFGLLAYILISTDWKSVVSSPQPPPSAVHLGSALLGVPEASPPATLSGNDSARSLPRTRVAYLLPFEIISVYLLVVLIGAAYLARAKRPQNTGESG